MDHTALFLNAFLKCSQKLLSEETGQFMVPSFSFSVSSLYTIPNEQFFLFFPLEFVAVCSSCSMSLPLQGLLGTAHDSGLLLQCWQQ